VTKRRLSGNAHFHELATAGSRLGTTAKLRVDERRQSKAGFGDRTNKRPPEGSRRCHRYVETSSTASSSNVFAVALGRMALLRRIAPSLRQDQVDFVRMRWRLHCRVHRHDRKV